MILVYAIKSNKTGRIYIGQTKNINNRLKYHNSGYVRTTKADAPCTVVAQERFKNRSEARWQERKLKESKGARDKWLQQYRV